MQSWLQSLRQSIYQGCSYITCSELMMHAVKLSKLTLPSHVRNLPLSLLVVVTITFSIDETEYSALMVPSTSQLTEASAAISLRTTHELRHIHKSYLTHVATSPGCIAKAAVLLPFLCNSAAIC